jgi:hypothetical protein
VFQYDGSGALDEVYAAMVKIDFDSKRVKYEKYSDPMYQISDDYDTTDPTVFYF